MPTLDSRRDAARPNASIPHIAEQEAADALQRLLGVQATRVEYPGGPSRTAVRVTAGSASFIVTRRRQSARAALEAGVLRELHGAGAPVPRVLGFDGNWLIQQDLGGQRLSTVLAQEPVGPQMHSAAIALLRCQEAAERRGLAQRVAAIGSSDAWLHTLIETPSRVALMLGIDDPALEDVVAPAHLSPLRRSFVKWDARPGNALVTADGDVAWIDWEHCGARDALDDLVWLLCDEYVPDDAAVEATLLERLLPLFADRSGRTPGEALVYLSRFGSFHLCVRLHLVLRHKADGPWWNREACLRTDRIGVTADAALALCERGRRWSGRWPGGEQLQRFFGEVARCIRAMQPDPAYRAFHAHHRLSNPGTGLGATV